MNALHVVNKEENCVFGLHFKLQTYSLTAFPFLSLLHPYDVRKSNIIFTPGKCQSEKRFSLITSMNILRLDGKKLNLDKRNCTLNILPELNIIVIFFNKNITKSYLEICPNPREGVSKNINLPSLPTIISARLLVSLVYSLKMWWIDQYIILSKKCCILLTKPEFEIFRKLPCIAWIAFRLSLLLSISSNILLLTNRVRRKLIWPGLKLSTN